MKPIARTTFTSEVSASLFRRVERAAGDRDVRAAVEANHDENRWWPTRLADWRLRMAVAGWSTRVSYRMIDTYAQVVTDAERIGYDVLERFSDDKLAAVVGPLGLARTRLGYFRSLCEFLDSLADGEVDPLKCDADEFIQLFTNRVSQAGYKVAQCATLYARGYHCGVIPVDSGMVERLAPLLGMSFARGAVGHEEMRQVLEACVADRADDYRRLARSLGYRVTIPDGAAPTWWVHLVLIYFKRLYCNGPSARLCPTRPACEAVLDCACVDGSISNG